MIHLTCNITNLYYLARWDDRELCNSLFERVAYCIYAIPHPDTSLWCRVRHFYDQNKVSHITNLAQNISFQKICGYLDCEEKCFQVANRILSKCSFGHIENNLRPHQNTFFRVIKHFQESGSVTGRGQTKENRCMALTPVNIKCVFL